MPVLRRDIDLQQGPNIVFHDLNSTDVVVQVRDEQGKVVVVGLDPEVNSTDYVTVEAAFPFRAQVLIAY